MDYKIISIQKYRSVQKLLYGLDKALGKHTRQKNYSIAVGEMRWFKCSLNSE